MGNDTISSEKNYSFTKKVWITAGIILFVVAVSLLFKTLFSLLLLVLAGALIAIYFYGFANIIHKKLHLPRGWSLGVSIVFNLILLIAFFWFIGARLQQQIADLSDTLPQTIEQIKSSMEETTVGSKVLNFMNASGNSKKTMAAVKQFFSSSFGILIDLYIIVLLAVFFIAAPSVYKKGFIKLMPGKAKGSAEEIIKKVNAAGLLNFIPNFGSIIALIPAALLGLTQGTTTTILVVCLYTFIQILQSAVTQPLIQQKMVNIPPALIIFAQVAMGLLGGFWGVLLATPVIAIIMTVVNKLYVEHQPSSQT